MKRDEQNSKKSSLRLLIKQLLSASLGSKAVPVLRVSLVALSCAQANFPAMQVQLAIDDHWTRQSQLDTKRRKSIEY